MRWQGRQSGRQRALQQQPWAGSPHDDWAASTPSVGASGGRPARGFKRQPSSRSNRVLGASGRAPRRAAPPPAPPGGGLGATGWRPERRRRGVSRPPRLDGRRLLGRLRIALAVLVAVAACALLIWVWSTPNLRVRHVRVTGTADPALVGAVGVLPLTGCFVLRCNLEHDTALVEQLPAVARADVSLVGPDTLLVRVIPREPVLIWHAYDTAMLVGSDGVLIGLASAADQARLSAVNDPMSAALGGAAPRPGVRLPAALVEMAMQLRSDLPSVMGAGVVLSYDAAAGLVAGDGRGLRVAFGDPSRPPGSAPDGTQGQIARLRAVLDTLAQRGQQAVWIDLRWGMYPSYRLAGS